MSLNSVPSSERVHIGFFGCRNAGKSSVVNAVTGQDLAVVSEVKGTTTDPVSKAMELLPLGPVVIIDTPGFDDDGEIGELRVMRTKRILNKTDIAVLVSDASRGINDVDRQLMRIFEEKNIPYLVVMNKSDLLEDQPKTEEKYLFVSALKGKNIHELKERLGGLVPEEKKIPLVGDLLKSGDTAVLVCPIDESAPKGRLILPQQQTIRDILDAGALAYVTKETELKAALESLKAPPAIVITDSQALAAIRETVPDDVPLTTFSIIMARYKGFLETAVAGIAAAKDLRDGDTVLMAEGCTHHRQCNDIGTVKIPRLLQAYCGCKLQFETCSGTEFPEELSRYAMVIHCGACMNSDRDVQYRMKCALDSGVPFTNYGITLAQVTGTLERTLRCFPDIHKLIV
ncbi:MAG: [FeFe] hydrogenase H-cluster maturation GTPase HydF [Clostridiales bacterium]|nr:[FeFe] hydrogenase H-cluster maturation GTPase HydF [Clostridiales bacterium]